MADEPKDADEQISDKIDNWVKMLLLRGGIRIVNFRNGDRITEAYGLVNVPAKYVNIIDAMHLALHAVARGEPLPEFMPPAPPKTGARRKR